MAFSIQDIVFTTSFDSIQGTFDTGLMIKLLLGGVWKPFETSQALRMPSIRTRITSSGSVGVLNVPLVNFPRI